MAARKSPIRTAALLLAFSNVYTFCFLKHSLGNEWWPGETATPWCDPRHLAYGDFDGKDGTDLICNSDNGMHLVAFSKGDGSFTRGTWWPASPDDGQVLWPGETATPWCGSFGVIDFRDFDGDGRTDLICNSNDGMHRVAASIGNGAFQRGKWWPSQPSEGVAIGPITLKRDVNGIAVAIPIDVSISLVTKANALQLKAMLRADLFDLQLKFGSIFDTFQLPRDNCASFTLLNPVVTAKTKELRPVGATAVVHLAGKIDGWTCAENPIPETYWDSTGCNVGRIVYGCPRTRPGSPIKIPSLEQPFTAELPLSLIKKGDQAVAIDLGQPSIDLAGQLAFLTKGVLSIAGIDINALVKDALDKAVNPSDLMVAIPEDYRALSPRIDETRFSEQDGHLLMNLSFSAAIPAEVISEYIRNLVSGLQPMTNG